MPVAGSARAWRDSELSSLRRMEVAGKGSEITANPPLMFIHALQRDQRDASGHRPHSRADRALLAAWLNQDLQVSNCADRRKIETV
jgi:hypothetical protein